MLFRGTIFRISNQQKKSSFAAFFMNKLGGEIGEILVHAYIPGMMVFFTLLGRLTKNTTISATAAAWLGGGYKNIRWCPGFNEKKRRTMCVARSVGRSLYVMYLPFFCFVFFWARGVSFRARTFWFLLLYGWRVLYTCRYVFVVFFKDAFHVGR